MSHHIAAVTDQLPILLQEPALLLFMTAIACLARPIWTGPFYVAGYAIVANMVASVTSGEDQFLPDAVLSRFVAGLVLWALMTGLLRILRSDMKPPPNRHARHVASVPDSQI